MPPFGENTKLTTTKFGFNKLETLLYRAVQDVLPYLKVFNCGPRVRHTDRQTDRQRRHYQQRV